MDESVSAFIVGTCRILPKTNTDVFESMHLQDSIPLESYLFVCGSCAEFFIQPIHSCIGDVDYCRMKPHSLAFTDEKPVLPYDVRHNSHTVDCFLIEPYLDYPGFVRLRLLGKMMYNWESKSFEFIHTYVYNRILTTTEMEGNVTFDKDGKWFRVGPATRFSLFDIAPLSTDIVDSIWCPQWPNEAKTWSNRQRKYGWPTTAIIHEVVQNGCLVVFAKHPKCRNDVHQFRMSFSVAEVILLQSWTTIQQIVYHMLRFFAKRELIQKDCSKEDEVLRTYHLKTLMLWSCEEKSPKWWNSSSLIVLCCKLLKKLAKWLTETRCPNYFIPQANLFHEHFNRKIVDETGKKLIYWYDSNVLSLWFLEHYMPPMCLDELDAKFTHDVLSRVYILRIHEALKAIRSLSADCYVSLRFRFHVQYIHNSLKDGFEIALIDIFKYSLRNGPVFEDKLHLLQTAEYESCFRFFGSMLHILCTAQLLDCKEVQCDSEWFVEVIRQISIKPKPFRSKHHNLPRPINTGVKGSQFYFIKAQDLMENLSGSNHHEEFQVLSEISKRLLWKALKCEDSNTIAKATLAYMAALHFADSEYQIVIDLCSRVIMNEKPEQEDTETLNAGCLLYIEDIAMIIGFYLIFMKIKDASLHYTKRQFFVDLRLTPEVFAQYLAILSVARTAGDFGPNHNFQTPTYPLDAILMTITNLRKSSQISEKRNSLLRFYQRTNPMNKIEARNENRVPNADDIILSLKQYALGNMTLFYNAIYTDFAIDCSTVDSYHAAYLYECRKYPEVLQLCERILSEADLRIHLKNLAFANVMILPPLICFFDRDIQCLVGLHTLVCYLSPLNEDLPKIEVSEMRTFQNHFAQEIYSSKRSLSAVLTETWFMKSHYFLGRHFLARYLRVRCLIDCNDPLSEVMLEFKNLKACLHFEHIIRCFLVQRLRQRQKVVDC